MLGFALPRSSLFLPIIWSSAHRHGNLHLQPVHLVREGNCRPAAILKAAENVPKIVTDSAWQKMLRKREQRTF